ncbi:uncharacterized protein LOC101854380 [Aplysia californica]|uniref:Uncharacterized protein LOC101854380 n=1 Tax=Aplysia californica TaxID=6500 RepID=A0ABM1A5F7_APLCA|nr:uncharacterized protein LOC101854380 [Aplysia californica]
MKNTEKSLVMIPMTWYVSRRFRRTIDYLDYRCRDRLNECMHRGTYDSPCHYIRSQTLCLHRYSNPYCSSYEMSWIRTAACDDDIELEPLWNNQTWPANEVLKLSVERASSNCTTRFFHCGQSSRTDSSVDSYCTMLQERKDCLVSASDNPTTSDPLYCSQSEWQLMSDAACTRSVINWQDDDWPVTTALQLTATLTSPDCQRRFESCREDFARGSVSSYCQLMEEYKWCIVGGSSTCSDDDWSNFKDSACNGHSGPASLNIVTLALLLMLSAFLLRNFV